MRTRLQLGGGGGGEGGGRGGGGGAGRRRGGGRRGNQEEEEEEAPTSRTTSGFRVSGLGFRGFLAHFLKALRTPTDCFVVVEGRCQKGGCNRRTIQKKKNPWYVEKTL